MAKSVFRVLDPYFLSDLHQILISKEQQHDKSLCKVSLKSVEKYSPYRITQGQIFVRGFSLWPLLSRKIKTFEVQIFHETLRHFKKNKWQKIDIGPVIKD